MADVYHLVVSRLTDFLDVHTDGAAECRFSLSGRQGKRLSDIKTFAHCAAFGRYRLIPLKNSCLIEGSIADSNPLLIGGFGDDGTKAGNAVGAVLRILA